LLRVIELFYPSWYGEWNSRNWFTIYGR
jgi:hypothetical protein